MFSIMKITALISNRLNLLPVIVFAALATLMSGCQSVPEASSAQQQQATSFTPPAGMAGLYVIRPWHLGGAAANWGAHLDYQDFGTLETSSYLYGAILPGKHFLRMGQNGETGVNTFIARAGENYYFAAKVSILGPIFYPISEADGQGYVRKFKQSGATTYKPPFNP
jgi:hypothetical protein